MLEGARPDYQLTLIVFGFSKASAMQGSWRPKKSTATRVESRFLPVPGIQIDLWTLLSEALRLWPTARPGGLSGFRASGCKAA